MKNCFSSVRCLLFLGVSLLAGRALGQNLLTNGSFEFPNTNGTIYGYAYFRGGSSGIPGWTTILNGVEYAAPSESQDGIHQVYLGLAEDGTYDIDLPPVTFTGGGIQQTFPTVAGATYVVNFYMGNVVFAGRDGSGTLTVSAANVTNSFTFINLTSFIQWAARSFNFTAVSNFTTLTFWSFDNPLLHFSELDNVSVTLLPAAAPILAINLYPGIQISGQSGHTYVLEYSTPPDTNLTQLQYVTLPTPSNLVYDVAAPGRITRSYRAFEFLSNQSLGNEVPVTVIGLVPGIQLTGAPGHNYTIQYSDNLPSTNWQSLSNFTLTTTTTTSFDPGSNATKQRFYQGMLVY
jgi:hypothetical protein